MTTTEIDGLLPSWRTCGTRTSTGIDDKPNYGVVVIILARKGPGFPWVLDALTHEGEMGSD